MPSSIKYTFCSEGPSDRVLLHHINWSLERLTTLPVDGEWADPHIFDNRNRDVATRVAQALSYYPCNLLFIHRDADGQGFLARRAEIRDAMRQAGIAIASVAVVPVRMTEAWLLSDEAALRSAAGRPAGLEKLHIPAVRSIEDLADPKTRFGDLLCAASEHRGRKLDQFRRSLPSLKYRVAELVDDFSPLLQLPSFQQFYDELSTALDAAGLR